jgi:hypothetical protein
MPYIFDKLELTAPNTDYHQLQLPKSSKLIYLSWRSYRNAAASNIGCTINIGHVSSYAWTSPNIFNYATGTTVPDISISYFIPLNGIKIEDGKLTHTMRLFAGTLADSIMTLFYEVDK